MVGVALSLTKKESSEFEMNTLLSKIDMRILFTYLPVYRSMELLDI